ncbi:undecaprenyl-phosphate glucose phosphotransferase [Xylophilus rhododendri]|uniref:Undecaprenyl-phosphate glucose phosphotransferase n=2 Tax=Xylophilus rhododendri TaxID=2697032 RepID=A0A857JEK2_9BURK|nr:undecaprenyl-phosphate glucose phosphotransferase [Xylophilus rhododendri]
MGLSIVVFALTFPGISRLQEPALKLVANVAFSWAWIAGLLLLGGYATRTLHQFSTAIVQTWLVVAPAMLVMAHFVVRWMAPSILSLEGAGQKVVIVGMNAQGLALADNIAQSPYTPMKLVGFFDDREPERLGSVARYPLIGRIEQLAAFMKEQRISVIFLSLPMAAEPKVMQILDALKDTTASIYFVPDMFVTDLIQGRTSEVNGVTVISVCETPFHGLMGVVKRCSDVLLSLCILVLIAPVLVAVAVAVKLSSPGPVIFRQRRYGLDGQEIVVYKFRSMHVQEDGASVRQAQKNDSRITPLGAILRRTSLDELPQFINVLQGRMSIVGPRPHAVSHNELYRRLIKGYMVRHKVKPGITGWAQVNGFRGETETLEKMQARIEYDLDYLRNWSLRLDLRIIFKTVRLVFWDRQAY